ncbi:MAG: molybdopterin-dependent oxidoreductase, partial [Planctomycetota bacterium]
VTLKRGDICSGAGEAAQEQDFGLSDSSDLFDLLHSRVIPLWGKNPFVSSVHLLPVLRKARDSGCRLVLIDPVSHQTAGLCERVIQPRPGGDFALAMGMARLLFESGWSDPESRNYCEHLTEYRKLVFSRSPQEWAGEAGVPFSELAFLAGLYGRSRPANIQVGWGMPRRANGSATVRALDALGAISGNLGIAGGGVSFYFARRAPFDRSFLRGREAAPRTVCEPLFGAELLALDDPPVRMVWVTAANPVAMLPDSKKVSRALRSREFVVVVDSFLTDTARCADLVLPTTTMLEEDDLLGAYGNHWIGNVRPVVPRPENVRSDFEIACELARRVGLASEFQASGRDWKKRLLSRLEETGIGLAELEKQALRNPFAPEILFQGRRFPTPTGRMRLLVEAPLDISQRSMEFPLYLMSLSIREAQASQTTAGAQEGPAEARVHPEAASGIPDGALARVESRIGEMFVRVRHDSSLRRDLLLVPKGGWLHRGRCANALVRARLTDAGEGAAYYDETVRLVPVEEGGALRPATRAETSPPRSSSTETAQR